VGVPSNIVNQLIQWIPAESITLYVGYVALLNPLKPTGSDRLCDLSFASRWLGFVVFCVVTLAITVGTYEGKRRAANPKPAFKLPLFEMVAQTLAFAAWAAALPETPFAGFCGFKSAHPRFIRARLLKCRWAQRSTQRVCSARAALPLLPAAELFLETETGFHPSPNPPLGNATPIPWPTASGRIIVGTIHREDSARWREERDSSSSRCWLPCCS
jgi:hypothetical protein